MKKISLLGLVAIGAIVAAPAMAADMPLKAPLAPVPPPFTWTGCYIGVEGGGIWGRTGANSNGTVNGVVDGTLGTSKVLTHDTDGGLIGGTLGCNYEFTNLVIGVEGDGSWAHVTGTSTLNPAVFLPTFSEQATQSSLFTVRGRLGYATGPLLLYVTGGGAWTDAKVHEFNTVAGAFGVCGGGVVAAGACTATESHTLSGWTAGGGVEYAFLSNWSVKAEYLHADFGRTNYFATTATACCTSENRRFTDDIVRVGLNWHFWGAIHY